MRSNNRGVSVVSSLCAVLMLGACGGSDGGGGASSNEPPATDGVAAPTEPIVEAPIDTAPVVAPDATLPADPGAPLIRVEVAPADICALLTTEEITAVVELEGYDLGANQIGTPAVSSSGNVCEVTVPIQGIISFISSFGATAEEVTQFASSPPAAQGDTYVFTPDNAVAQGWVLLASGAAVDVSYVLPFELSVAQFEMLATALQS